MKILKPEAQESAKEKIVNYINQKIKETPSEQEEMIIDIADLFIDCSAVDCGEPFMDKLCREFEQEGWFIKYCPFLSFIWRHKVILSKNPIKDWQPIKSGSYPRSKYQCSYFKSPEAEKNFDAEFIIKIHEAKKEMGWFNKIFANKK